MHITRLALLICLVFAGCKPLQVNNLRDRTMPSNDRDWFAELTTLPTAEINGNSVTVHNIRNCNYVTEDDFTLEYYNRTFDIDEIRSVDYVVVPFQGKPFIAHTMLSFELESGEYIAVSAEIRTEKQEGYSSVLGVSNQFELTYVLGSEQDLIRLRTRHRDAEVYIYPTIATPKQAQGLFLSVAKRINKLAKEPEFYNTLTNNCTTNIFNHVRELQQEQSAIDVLKYSWQVLLPGYSDQFAYDQGFLRSIRSFKETKRLALVNDLAELHFDDPDFSQQIRIRHAAMMSSDSSEPATR